MHPTITTGKLTDSVGPENLVRHMQSLSYAYDRLGPSYASMYVIVLRTSLDRYKSQNSKKSLPGWTIVHVFVC